MLGELPSDNETGYVSRVGRAMQPASTDSLLYCLQGRLVAKEYQTALGFLKDLRVSRRPPLPLFDVRQALISRDSAGLLERSYMYVEIPARG